MSEKTRGADCIHIESLELQVHIGVPDAERASPQRVICNMTLEPVRSVATLDDNIGRAVDYAAVCAETAKFVQQRSDKLLETLTDAVACHLLGTFEIAKITVEFRKFVVPGTEFVSVTVTRER